jgi:hypothetical protein
MKSAIGFVNSESTNALPLDKNYFQNHEFLKTKVSQLVDFILTLNLDTSKNEKVYKFIKFHKEQRLDGFEETKDLDYCSLQEQLSSTKQKHQNSANEYELLKRGFDKAKIHFEARTSEMQNIISTNKASSEIEVNELQLKNKQLRLQNAVLISNHALRNCEITKDSTNYNTEKQQTIINSLHDSSIRSESQLNIDNVALKMELTFVKKTNDIMEKDLFISNQNLNEIKKPFSQQKLQQHPERLIVLSESATPLATLREGALVSESAIVAREKKYANQKAKIHNLKTILTQSKSILDLKISELRTMNQTHQLKIKQYEYQLNKKAHEFKSQAIKFKGLNIKIQHLNQKLQDAELSILSKDKDITNGNLLVERTKGELCSVKEKMTVLEKELIASNELLEKDLFISNKKLNEIKKQMGQQKIQQAALSESTTELATLRKEALVSQSVIIASEEKYNIQKTKVDELEIMLTQSRLNLDQKEAELNTMNQTHQQRIKQYEYQLGEKAHEFNAQSETLNARSQHLNEKLHDAELSIESRENHIQNVDLLDEGTNGELLSFKEKIIILENELIASNERMQKSQLSITQVKLELRASEVSKLQTVSSLNDRINEFNKLQEENSSQSRQLVLLNDQKSQVGKDLVSVKQSFAESETALISLRELALLSEASIMASEEKYCIQKLKVDDLEITLTQSRSILDQKSSEFNTMNQSHQQQIKQYEYKFAEQAREMNAQSVNLENLNTKIQILNQKLHDAELSIESRENHFKNVDLLVQGTNGELYSFKDKTTILENELIASNERMQESQLSIIQLKLELSASEVSKLQTVSSLNDRINEFNKLQEENSSQSRQLVLLNEQKSQVEKDLVSVKQSFAESETALITLRELQLLSEASIMASEERYCIQKSKVDDLEITLTQSRLILDQKSAEFNTMNQSHQQQIKQYEYKFAEQAREMNAQNVNLENLNTKIQILNQKLHDAELSIESRENHFKNVDLLVEGTNGELLSCKEKINILENKLIASNEKMQESQLNTTQLKLELKFLEDSKLQTASSLNDRIKEFNKLQDENATHARQLVLLNAQKSQVGKDLVSVKQSFAESETALITLRELQLLSEASIMASEEKYSIQKLKVHDLEITLTQSRSILDQKAAELNTMNQSHQQQTKRYEYKFAEQAREMNAQSVNLENLNAKIQILNEKLHDAELSIESRENHIKNVNLLVEGTNGELLSFKEKIIILENELIASNEKMQESQLNTTQLKLELKFLEDSKLQTVSSLNDGIKEFNKLQDENATQARQLVLLNEQKSQVEKDLVSVKQSFAESETALITLRELQLLSEASIMASEEKYSIQKLKVDDLEIPLIQSRLILDQKASELNTIHQSHQQQIKQYEYQLEQKRHEVNVQIVNLESLNAKVQNLNQTLVDSEISIESSRNEIENVNLLFEEKNSELCSVKERKNDLEKELIASYERIQESHLNMTQLKLELSALEDSNLQTVRKLQDTELSIQSRDNDIRKVNLLVEGTKADLCSVKEKNNRLEKELIASNERMQESHLNMSQLKLELRALEISKLSSLNDRINEFNKLQVKNDSQASQLIFLVEQKSEVEKDLVSIKQSFAESETTLVTLRIMWYIYILSMVWSCVYILNDENAVSSMTSSEKRWFRSTKANPI